MGHRHPHTHTYVLCTSHESHRHLFLSCCSLPLFSLSKRRAAERERSVLLRSRPRMLTLSRVFFPLSPDRDSTASPVLYTRSSRALLYVRVSLSRESERVQEGGRMKYTRVMHYAFKNYINGKVQGFPINSFDNEYFRPYKIPQRPIAKSCERAHT